MSRGDRHAASRKARELGVSASWLRTQRRRVERHVEPKGPGRPATPDAERARVRALVAAQRQIQGSTTGARTILRVLRESEPEISQMLVEEELASLKAADRVEKARVIEAVRVSHEVLGRDTIWGEDTTHLGRDETGAEIACEHVRDRATLKTVALSAGPPPTAVEVIEQLRRAALERGGWPLAIQVDNASIYLAEIVRQELAAQRVVLLRSRVHTPTDNPATEHAHREVKDEAGLGKGVIIAPEAARARVDHARDVLDNGRCRASRGWHTAAQLDAIVPRGDACVDRQAFYDAAQAPMNEAVRGAASARQARKAQRQAFFKTLCEFGLARVHRGRRPRIGSIPLPVEPMTCGMSCAGRLD